MFVMRQTISEPQPAETSTKIFNERKVRAPAYVPVKKNNRQMNIHHVTCAE